MGERRFAIDGRLDQSVGEPDAEPARDDGENRGDRVELERERYERLARGTPDNDRRQVTASGRSSEERGQAPDACE